MSLHNEYVIKIKEQATRLQDAAATTAAVDEEQERLLICSAIIKCADISNVVCRQGILFYCPKPLTFFFFPNR
jgi:hypothetical protein